jgi:cyanophycinase
MRRLAASLLLAFATLAAPSQTAIPTHASFYRVGAATELRAHPRPHPRAGYALMGGGTDLDEAFRWLCGRADGGDLVVLRASGDDAYNAYINGLCKLNSITTVVIPGREAAGEAKVAETIRGASAIFISGGDQSKYTRYWRGTPVETALRDAVKRGVPIGGTSAGLAVLGEFIYSAEGDKPDDADLTSEAAMANPFYRQVVISSDLLGIPILRGIITDSHFDTRRREGRLLVFVARILQSGQAARMRGVGVDEKTALLVEPDGKARVVGKGNVDFYDIEGKPAVCEPGKPLQIDKNAQGWEIPSGEAFDLRAWRGFGRPFNVRVLVVDGQPSVGRFR